MILKLIFFLFGKLTPEQKQEVVNTLSIIVKAGAEGAVKGMKK